MAATRLWGDAGVGQLNWVGSAFGLSIRSGFELPGLVRASRQARRDGPRRLDLALSPGAQRPDVERGERLQEWRRPDGSTGLAIDWHADAGYRFYVREVGVFELAPDGSRAVSRPARDSGWHWRRYLTGQVLPFAALLQGVEVFHASAVELDGRAVALMGASGLGKSTLALNLHLAGAGFLTDDVLALESDGPQILAHPGMAMAKVRQRARGLVAADRQGALGDPVSEDEHEVRYQLRRASRPLPVSAVCMLERSSTGAGIELTGDEVSPWHLLGGTFNLLVRDPQRLRVQLDLCAAIARQARCLRVRVPSRPGPAVAARLADALKDLSQEPPRRTPVPGTA